MTPRTAVLVGAGVVGSALALSRLPVTRRFVATVRTASREREAELREAVEVAVRTDATVRAPRHAPGARLPSLEVEAGWGQADADRPGATALTGDDPGRSLTPEEARALLLDPTGPGRDAPSAEARAR